MSEKLPEVGEFWRWKDASSRIHVVHVNAKRTFCCMEDSDGDLYTWPIEDVAQFATYLPWCKSFTDAEPPKPEMETVVFYEVVYVFSPYRQLSWVDKVVGDDAIPTGRTETRELPKR